MYPAILIANYFVNKGIQENKPITPMQAVKLTYIAHGWHLGYNDDPLIDEHALAWQYGPVITSVYDVFKMYGKNPINRLYAGNSEMGRLNRLEEIDKEDQELLDVVWKSYKKFTGIELSMLTHEKGSPWYITWHLNSGSEYGNMQIPDKLIKEHYKSRINERDKSA